MATAVAADKILRLHTDTDGSVWVGLCSIGSLRTKLCPASFVKEGILRDAEEIRLLGVPENAPLITRLFELRIADPRTCHAKIYVGSPGICFNDECLSDPQFVLRQMWQQPCQAKVCGCWHELTQMDYTTYYMLCALRQAGQVNDVVRKIAPYHPAWPAVTFMPEADLDAACELLCDIIDPRWYTHTGRPGRTTRLFSFLGLVPINFDSTAGAQQLRMLDWSPGQGRARLTLRAWRGRGEGASLNDPRNFLERIYRHHGGGARGLLRASQVYVQFVKLAWLQGLSNSRHEIFVPEIFFKLSREAEVYREHVSLVKKQL